MFYPRRKTVETKETRQWEELTTHNQWHSQETTFHYEVRRILGSDNYSLRVLDQYLRQIRMFYVRDLGSADAVVNLIEERSLIL